jgi:two-component sensor histidine kinase
VAFDVEGDAGVLPAQVTTTLAVVLTELLQNAVDHAFLTVPGGGEPDDGATVAIHLNRRSDGLTLSVIDNGVGLPEDFRLEDATGLGLTIVKTFVEGELGGSIGLSPVVRGRGTVAEVQVPAARLVGVRDEAQEPLA